MNARPWFHPRRVRWRCSARAAVGERGGWAAAAEVAGRCAKARLSRLWAVRERRSWGSEAERVAGRAPGVAEGTERAEAEKAEEGEGESGGGSEAMEAEVAKGRPREPRAARGLIGPWG